jgi:hypothetical protein
MALMLYSAISGAIVCALALVALLPQFLVSLIIILPSY